MMKKLVLLVTLVVLLSMAVCHASETALNDVITPDSFTNAFNERCEIENDSLRIFKGKHISHDEKRGMDVHGYLVTNADHPKNSPILIIALSNPLGELYGIQVLAKMDMYQDYESALKDAAKYMIIVERTVGMPSGEAAVDGMFAVSDALTKKKGSYWSEETERRYIVVPVRTRDRVGLYIHATI